MEAPQGPPRFTCPPEFSASLFCPGAPFSQETLQGPSKELWLIRAPASFSPESLDGHSVPLQGSQSLKASQPGGTEKTFHVQMALEHDSGARLLLPPDHGDHLTCSPPFSGSLSICERYGDPSRKQPLFTLAARPRPQIPGGLKQRFLPFGSSPGRAVLPRAEEEHPKKKKKKKKKHRLGEEDAEDLVPPLGETTGTGETEASGQHDVDGAAPLETTSQPSSAAVAQNSILSGEPEDLAPLSKKKKTRKEDKLKEVVGGEAEARLRHEDWAAALPVDSQTSSAADAPNSLLCGEAEELGPRIKKKKKRKEGGGLEEEMRGEAKPASPHQLGGIMPSPQPDPTAVARDSLLLGEVEDLAPSRKKKKKKKRRDDEEVEETGMETEATHPHGENGTTPQRISPQPSSRLIAQDDVLSSEAENPASIGKKKKKKKKKRKEGQEGKEKMEGEAEELLDLGTHSEPQAGEGSLPGTETVTQDTHLEKSSKERAVSPELFSSQEDTVGRLWDFSTPEGGLVLPKGNPAVGSSSHKAKKRKKEKPAQELEGWPAQQGTEGLAELSTPLGGGGGQVAGHGREELSQKQKKKERHRLQAAHKGWSGLEGEVGSS